MEVAAAEPCLLRQWAPENIPVDPSAPVYLRLGDEGCARIEPLLGSTHDVQDGGYRLTAVLPFRVQRNGTAEIVDAVRLRSEDGSKRLTIDRADLDRCVSSEPRAKQSSATKMRATTLPIAGVFGPSPLVLAYERLDQAHDTPTVSVTLEGASKPTTRAFNTQTWSREGRTVSTGAGDPVSVRVRTSVGPVSGLPETPAAAPAVAPNPDLQRKLARVEAERIAAAWAGLEARYPSEDAAGYLETAQARQRREEAEVQTVPKTRPVPGAVTPVGEQLAVEGVVTLGGFKVATRFDVRAWASAEAKGRQRNQALQQQAAFRLRRLVDVAALAQRLVGAQGSTVFVSNGLGAGLAATASVLADGAVAMIHGWLVDRPGAGVTEIPVKLPRGRQCVLLAAESLSGDETAAIELDLGMANGEAFTSLAADLRGVPRPAVRACNLPEDVDLLLRVESDTPFAVGMLTDGEDITAGHFLASLGSPLLPLVDGGMLDGALGIPEPTAVAASTAEAERLILTFSEGATP